MALKNEQCSKLPWLVELIEGIIILPKYILAKGLI